MFHLSWGNTFSFCHWPDSILQLACVSLLGILVPHAQVWETQLLTSLHKVKLDFRNHTNIKTQLWICLNINQAETEAKYYENTKPFDFIMLMHQSWKLVCGVCLAPLAHVSIIVNGCPFQKQNSTTDKKEELCVELYLKLQNKSWNHI